MTSRGARLRCFFFWRQAQDSLEPGAWSLERVLGFGRFMDVETSDVKS